MSNFIGVKMVDAVPIEKAKDQIWSGLGFVLQWAINGLNKK